MSQGSGGQDAVKTAGRGALFIAAAKATFLISGLGLTFWMPRLIVDATGAQDPAQFGRYRVAAQTMSILAQAILLSILQVVSKFSAEQREAAARVMTFVSKRALPVVLVIGGLAQFFAPSIAAFLNDPALTPLLRAAFLIPVFYGCYALFIGLANGSQAFKLQASLDGSFSFLKLGCIVAGAMLLPRWVDWPSAAAIGGLLGWASAAAIIASAAFVGTMGLRRSRRGEARIDGGQILRFAAGIVLYTLTFELLKQVDLLVVKASAERLGSGGQALVGQYSAALDFARVPYFLVMGVSLVLFPMLSAVSFAGDEAAVRRYIHNATRFTFGLAAVTSAGIFVVAPALLPGLFGAAYAPAVPILRWLCVGQVAFALVTIAMNILNASGRPLQAFAMVVVMAVSSAIVVPMGVAAGGVEGAAGASVLSLCLGAALSMALVKRQLGAALAPMTFVRVAVAALLLGALALLWTPGNLLAGIGGLAVVGLADLAILTAMRELGASDLALLRRVIGR